MKNTIRWVARLAVVAMVAAPAWAQAKLIVTEGWARATVAGQTMGGAFVTLHNTGSQHVHVLSVQSPVSSRTELHEMMQMDGVMHMHPMDGGLQIEPNETVMLKPGAQHVMFTGLKHALSAGQSVPMVLTYVEHGNKTRKVVRFNAVVRALGG